MNANSHTLDAAFGVVTTLNLQGLSGAQALAVTATTNLVLTGIPNGAVTIQLPAGVGRFFFVSNLATGPNSTVSFGSASVAPVVAVPGGYGAAIVIDPVYGGRRADSIAEEAVGPAGAVQYAGANGQFAGDAGLVYTPSNQNLAVGGALAVGGNFTLTGLMTSRLTLFTASACTLSVAIPFAGTGMQMDCSQSNVFTTTLSGAVTGAVSIVNMDDGQCVNWRLQQDATGNRTMAWPSNFRWPGGTPAALSTGANAVDLLVASYFGASGTWLANLIKGFA